MHLPSLIAAAALALAALPAAHANEATPCTDFDAWVNGGWRASIELPAERARIGSFDTLRVANAKLLERALAELVADPARQTSPGLKLLAASYQAGMDRASIAARGLSPLQPQLRGIDEVTRDSLPALMGQLARLGSSAPLAFSIGPDARDGARHALVLSPGGLGLPDRADYVDDDDRSRRLREAYRLYAQRLLKTAGYPADDATIDALLALETELARATAPREQRRDPMVRYNPMSPEQLHELAPPLAPRTLLAAYAHRPDGVAITVVAEPEFVKAVGALVAQAPLASWRSYLRVRLLDLAADRLPPAFADAHFAYRGGAIRGLKAPLPRAEQLILQLGGAYGSAPLALTLGELYASRAHLPQAQARALQMVADIKAAMRERIGRLGWMSEATRERARAKLDAMVTRIGMPERWPSYAGLVLDPADHAGNLLRVAAWATARRVAELDQPVDRLRWTTSPHIVNAFAAAGNAIVFPAGILQPPFFDASADDATNYGAIGMIIGHEITHHFDDRGRRYDHLGNLNDWWTPQDASAYRSRAARVAALYGGYEPLPGVRINGRLTLGENISDLAGLQIAYDGLQIALARQRAAGKAPVLVDGQTPEQRFFIANAIVWRSKSRSEALMDQLRTDGHSPGRFRVLGPMSQTPAFAKAFGCKAGDPMVAAEPLQIW
ncbi:MAG: M13 family metallopeptidase [Rubrivivax sp.]|nr:M13 family metallopeptidase [Rubrivivax sp.]